MQKRQRSHSLLLGSILFIYILLVTILYLSEKSADGATIRSFGDAVWYSVVTLSTVGYGDITPVTTVGHVIGTIFLVLAAGTLVTMLSAAVSFISSEGLPLLKLKLQRKKNWYYFADSGEEAQTLAGNIMKEDENALIIFGEKNEDRSMIPDYPCIFTNLSLARIISVKNGEGERMKIFLMKENDIGFNPHSINLHELPVEVYANSTNGEDTLGGNIHFFHAYDCCAREYWRTHPLNLEEETIVLIGFEHYGRRILERAIMNNVLSVNQHVAYHIFGDSAVFRNMHPYLDQIFSVNEESMNRDSLIFHEDDWVNHHELIAKADRIIIADDDMAGGWDIFWRIRKYYRHKGRIDLRNNRVSPGVSYFGTDEEIYKPEHIMQTSLNKAAIIMNEIFRNSVDYPTLSWEKLDDFHRQSKIAAADHLLYKIRILLKDESIMEYSVYKLWRAYEIYQQEIQNPERQEELRQIEYMRWSRFYYFFNWQYGVKKCESARIHPMLGGYDQLTEAQKIERDSAWEILGSLANEWKYWEE